MFDAIAPRYDLLNRLLSAGLDRRWRSRAIEALAKSGDEWWLDVCTGTADLAIAAVQHPMGARSVLGVDFAGEMLVRGGAKLRRRGLRDRVRLVRGDASILPVATASVDAVTVAFGIRNVQDEALALREISRVLRRGGQVAVLEFGFPTVPIVRTAYRWYFQRLLPRIGRLVSRHASAYTYLPASVSAFSTPDAFTRLLREAGFSDIRYSSLSLGVVYLYVAQRA